MMQVSFKYWKAKTLAICMNLFKPSKHARLLWSSASQTVAVNWLKTLLQDFLGFTDRVCNLLWPEIPAQLTNTSLTSTLIKSSKCKPQNAGEGKSITEEIKSVCANSPADKKPSREFSPTKSFAEKW